MDKEILDIFKEEIGHLQRIKDAIGDINGFIHEFAVKIAKIYLTEKHRNVKEWELQYKYGSGIDIIGKNLKGEIILAAEVKTTGRAEKEQLGATQRKNIIKDIDRLIKKKARYSYFFIISDRNKKAISSIINNKQAKYIKIVNLLDI